MREIRQSGSEGGEAESIGLSYPYQAIYELPSATDIFRLPGDFRRPPSPQRRGRVGEGEVSVAPATVGLKPQASSLQGASHALLRHGQSRQIPRRLRRRQKIAGQRPRTRPQTHGGGRRPGPGSAHARPRPRPEGQAGMVRTGNCRKSAKRPVWTISSGAPRPPASNAPASATTNAPWSSRQIFWPPPWPPPHPPPHPPKAPP